MLARSHSSMAACFDYTMLAKSQDNEITLEDGGKVALSNSGEEACENGDILYCDVGKIGFGVAAK